MRKFTKRRSSRRGRPSFKRRVAFVRKTFRKGFKPRTSLKRSRYARSKKTVKRRSVTSFRANSAFTKRVLAVVSAPNFYNNSVSLAFATTVGNCTWCAPIGAYDFNDLANIINSLSSSETVNSISTPYTDRIFVQSCTIMNTMTNACNSTVNVEMYYYRPRRDVPIGQGTTMTAFLADGFADALSDTAPRNMMNDTSITAFQSPTLVQWFKITKVKKFKLAPGRSIRYMIKVGADKVMHNELYQDTTPALGFYRKHAGAFFKIYGEPVTDTASASHVSWGSCKVTHITNQRYEWRYIPNHQGHDVHVDYLPTFSGGEQHIQQDGPNTAVTQVFA
nr:MAG: capsid protein [Cressdnaviricota sp.]